MTAPAARPGRRPVGVGLLDAAAASSKFNEWVAFTVESPSQGSTSSSTSSTTRSSSRWPPSLASALSAPRRLLVYFAQKAPKGLLERNGAARGVYTCSRTSTGSTSSAIDDIAGGTAGRSPGAATGSTSTSSTVWSTASAARPGRGALGLRRTSTRAPSTARSTGPQGSGAVGRHAPPLQNGRVQRYALYLFSSVIVISLSVALFV